MWTVAMFMPGFRKISNDRWEFAKEEFLRGKSFLLKNINRRRSSRAQNTSPYLGSSMEMELSGTEVDVQKLKSENCLLRQEIVEMEQEHLVTVDLIDKLKRRLRSAEIRQKQMMFFCARVLRNSSFLMQIKKAKKQREIASMRPIKVFLEQEQPLKSCVNEYTTQQIDKCRQCFCDISVKLGLDVMVHDGRYTEPLEILEPSFSSIPSFKGKNPMIFEEDACLSSADFRVSSPSGFVYCKEEFWDVDFEAGGSFTSSQDAWDKLVCTNTDVPGVEPGLSELRDIGLHSDPGFDIGKCFDDQFPLSQHTG